jgi:hypothetical protein
LEHTNHSSLIQIPVTNLLEVDHGGTFPEDLAKAFVRGNKWALTEGLVFLNTTDVAEGNYEPQINCSSLKIAKTKPIVRWVRKAMGF